jgi:hypothetical protein
VAVVALRPPVVALGSAVVALGPLVVASTPSAVASGVPAVTLGSAVVALGPLVVASRPAVVASRLLVVASALPVVASALPVVASGPAMGAAGLAVGTGGFTPVSSVSPQQHVNRAGAAVGGRRGRIAEDVFQIPELVADRPTKRGRPALGVLTFSMNDADAPAARMTARLDETVNGVGRLAHRHAVQVQALFDRMVAAPQLSQLAAIDARGRIVAWVVAGVGIASGSLRRRDRRRRLRPHPTARVLFDRLDAPHRAPELGVRFIVVGFAGHAEY